MKKKKMETEVREKIRKEVEEAYRNELRAQLVGKRAATNEGYVIEIADINSFDDMTVRYRANGKIVEGVSMAQFQDGSLILPTEFGKVIYGEDGNAAVVKTVNSRERTVAIQFANGRTLPKVPVELFNSGAFRMPNHCIHSKGHPTKDRKKKGKVSKVEQSYELSDGQTLDLTVSQKTPVKEGHEKLREPIMYMAGTAQKDGEVAYVIGYEGRNKMTVIFPGLDDAVRTNVNKTKFLNGQFGHRKGKNFLKKGDKGYPDDLVEEFYKKFPDGHPNESDSQKEKESRKS